MIGTAEEQFHSSW